MLGLYRSIALLLSMFVFSGYNVDNAASSIDCNGEKMVYTSRIAKRVSLRVSLNGQKFDCSYTWLLERYKLSDKYAINETIEVKSPGHSKFVFVTATNDKYYPSLRKLLANIKETFGCKQQIIAYDLGTVTKNKEWMNELDSVCNLQWRIFDFTQMVERRVQNLKSYAWKIFVLAHVLMEYDTVVWLDTSILFKSNNLAKFLVPMQKGTIGPVQVLSFSTHGMNIATHPGMYKFLPLYTDFFVEKNITYELTGNNDPPQFETGFVIVQKSEQSRQLMKWFSFVPDFLICYGRALLCAAEPDCIVPIGQTQTCISTKLAPNLTCHRQDQSLIEILRYNMEYRLKMEDPSFLPQTSPDHPRSTHRPLNKYGMNGLFNVYRHQEFSGSNEEWLQKVKCCS